MEPQRRTALFSVFAALALIALKLGTGLATHSLGLISEAIHSGTDLVAALLTFFAVGVAVRPADPGHQYGHGKAEHLSALAEAAFLVAASLFIAWRAVRRLTESSPQPVHAAWWALLVVGVVILVDLSRTTASARAARRYDSAALSSNALHFASDLAGSAAVLAGLLLARVGQPKGDAAAALFVAVLVLAAAFRLMRRNVDVLMDRVPADAAAAARSAIAAIVPPVELRRLRMRQAAGRHFADVVIGVSVDSAVRQGHAAADAVERAVQTALPEADVVVHVEPEEAGAAVRERAHAAALGVPRVREVHNVTAVAVGSGTELSLHLKLPADLALDEAHAIAEQVERAIREEVPEVSSVQTHIEPLTEEAAGTRPPASDIAREHELVRRIAREETGREPRALRFLDTDEGLVAYLTLAVDGETPLGEAHARASRIEERIRRERPDISDVIVHTEP
ncbi:MAG TPA: cation diffusion facilitator family transporter [Gaiellaceae bacterium]|jgi:cation diffusion facilitator family transporter|nr:cation diffusion facilitator family transporter [Gaiellaceae bacterium]